MTTDQRHERNNPDESYGDCYVYLYDVPSLQEIASHEVVREIWHINLSTYHPMKDKETNVIPCSEFLEYCDEYGCQQQQAKEMIMYLKVPHCVEEMLKNSLKAFCAQIRHWVGHLLRIVFRHVYLRGSHEIQGIDPKWCIWSIYDEIDYEKSARKILEIGSLTNLQKFLIMCEYCMEDEIKKFSLDLLPSEFIEKVDFYTHRSNFYWICFLKNELHRMPVENPLFADLSEHQMIYSNGVSGNTFFWYRLSNDDQVQIATDWIRKGLVRDFTFLKQILSVMSWYQQQRLLSELSDMSDKIIIRFAVRSSRIALWMWKYFKDEMAVEQFRKFFCDLICSGTSTSTLLEIWKTASDQQRNYFNLNMSEEFIYSYIQAKVFMFGSLEAGILRTRRNLMLQKPTQDVMPWHNPYLLNNIVDGRSPCSEDQLTFMKLAIDSFRFVRHLKRIFYQRNLEMFDNELKAYFLQDVNAAREYKQLFLFQVDRSFIDELRLITNVNLWDEFCNFIEEAFENDEAGALKVKRRFISSIAFFTLWSRLIDPQCYFDLRRGFDDLTNIVETVFGNKTLIVIKHDFSIFFRDLKMLCSFVNFDEKFNSKFELWSSVVWDDEVNDCDSDSNVHVFSDGDDEDTDDEDEDGEVRVLGENENNEILNEDEMCMKRIGVWVKMKMTGFWTKTKILNVAGLISMYLIFKYLRR
ncbi:uncharacterized protein LOC135845419 [Planococcus citri]|uniref:uncharacterized protein LOC135845419 n=1 Tax=Planococcus citri TaxID=170843 RepID=UPI0031FA0594